MAAVMSPLYFMKAKKSVMFIVRNIALVVQWYKLLWLAWSQTESRCSLLFCNRDINVPYADTGIAFKNMLGFFLKDKRAAIAMEMRAKKMKRAHQARTSNTARNTQ